MNSFKLFSLVLFLVGCGAASNKPCTPQVTIDGVMKELLQFASRGSNGSDVLYRLVGISDPDASSGGLYLAHGPFNTADGYVIKDVEIRNFKSNDARFVLVRMHMQPCLMLDDMKTRYGSAVLHHLPPSPHAPASTGSALYTIDMPGGTQVTFGSESIEKRCVTSMSANFRPH